MDYITHLFAGMPEHPWAVLIMQFGGMALAVWLSHVLASSLLVRVIGKLVRTTPAVWDDVLFGRTVTSRLAYLVPALVAYYGVELVPGLPAKIVPGIRVVANMAIIFTFALSLSRLLDAFLTLYEQHDPARARERPIKGYMQLVKIVVWLVTSILIMGLLLNRNPLLLLSGLGALTAVLMLVFKDTLLSFVASVQITAHDMLRVGDWIEMTQLQADGYAIDITLHTVKVQNWDHTITTIPTWRLIGESFRNWRGVFETGGRRIKRSLFLDQTSIRFIDVQEAERLRRISTIVEYLDAKRRELVAFNRPLVSAGQDPVNSRRLTNAGTFRAYVLAYLQKHPGVHQQMDLLVRQLAPGPTGLPLEIYCFAATADWVQYEDVQSDIFDHLYAILPEFGLRIFQQPRGTDSTK